MVCIRKLFCPHCLNEQNIECEIYYDQHAGVSIGVPYCTKCKEKILELKNEFILDYQVNDYSEMKDTEEESNKTEEWFSDNPYEFLDLHAEAAVDRSIYILIGLVYLFFLIITIISKKHNGYIIYNHFCFNKYTCNYKH